MAQPVHSVCVYCGASGQVADTYRQAAQVLGARLAERGLRLVYGGGRVGLMGLVADAVLAGGGQAVGIIPQHILAFEVGHTNLTELHVVDSMHTRKRMMMDLSDAFLVLPGGLGTLDEAFEVLTWKQLGLHTKPVVIVDIDGYWQPLAQLITHLVDSGFARPAHGRLFAFAKSVDAALALLERRDPANGTTVPDCAAG